MDIEQKATADTVMVGDETEPTAHTLSAAEERKEAVKAIAITLIVTVLILLGCAAYIFWLWLMGLGRAQGL